MVGMNLVFHVAAALALLGLGYALIALQRQRDLLRRLLGAASAGRADEGKLGGLYVAAPPEFVGRWAEAVGIAVEGRFSLPPVKIELGPWAELFSRAKPSLLRWRGSPQAPTLCIHLGPGKDLPPELLRKLAQSLGGGSLNVQIGD